MKRVIFVGICIFLIIFFIIINLYYGSKRNEKATLHGSDIISKPVNKNMKITSSAFTNKQQIPEKYTCKGANINPPLEFLDVPENTKSLALIVDDPDAPMGTWVHWVVINMEPRTLGIEENSKPTSGTEGITSFGKPHYGGPCPPSGTHRYFFKLYALDTKLGLTATADKKAVETQMQGHILDQAEIIGIFSK